MIDGQLTLRCAGSDKPPRRTFRGRAECQVCGGRFSAKADGQVRRHQPRQRPSVKRAWRKVTQK